MMPIARTAQNTTVGRLGATHRAAEGAITSYLRDISAVSRREPDGRRVARGGRRRGLLAPGAGADLLVCRWPISR
jgi:hypothetical protein